MLIYYKHILFSLIMGYLLDLLFGDPRWLYHPICIIGNSIALFEKAIRKIFPKSKEGELIGGLFLVIITLSFTVLLFGSLIFIGYKINMYLGLAISVLFCYQLFATKCLKKESMNVYYALKDNGLDAGRKAVGMIVGRDTKALDEIGVIKATIETVAENFSDGVLAPMIFMTFLGPVGMFIYKAINTMDSMVGYKNEKYLYFGRAAARLDDAANFIPARIAGLIFVISAFILSFNGRNSWKIFKRDRLCHASPNSAQTESAVAGALEIQLAGNAYYFGKLYEKPYIGDAHRAVSLDDIKCVNKMMYMASFLGMVISCAILASIIFILN